MQKPAKLFVSSAVCLMITLLTSPADTQLVPLTGFDLGALAGPLVVAWALNSAFTIGATLGQESRARRGRYRSSGHSYGRRRYGKREAEQTLDEDQGQNDIETNLISDGFNLMMSSDPNDCFKRIICDIATGEKDYSIMSPLLNFVSDDEDNHVPPELKQFSFSLKMARKIGEAGRNTDICQETFKCPFTGEEMLRMKLGEFQPRFAKTLQSGFESRKAFE